MPEADTDEDGLSDAIELELGTGTDRRDTDYDSLDDGDEVLVWGTDPTNRDTDGDTLSDGREANTLGTLPTQADTDGDGVNDAQDADPLTVSEPSSPAPTMIVTVNPEDCSGSPSPSRYAVGMNAEIPEDTVPYRIRLRPDPSAVMIGQMPPGSRFLIINGPVCDDVQFLRWWQVEYQDVVIGWMAEGRSNGCDDFFCPDPLATDEPSNSPVATTTLVPLPEPTECPDSSPTSLRVGDMAQASDSSTQVSLSIREEPHPEAPLTAVVTPGSSFLIIDGPICDGTMVMRWWQVRWRNVIGWIAEGWDSCYLCAPPNSLREGSTMSLTSSDFPAIAPIDCPGSPSPSRYAVGMNAEVPEDAVVPYRLREAPDPTAAMIDQMPPGSRFLIINGPVCDDVQFLRWWQIKYQGIEGWMAEGRANGCDDFFCPDPLATDEP